MTYAIFGTLISTMLFGLIMVCLLLQEQTAVVSTDGLQMRVACAYICACVCNAQK
jgi:hypothetical protein